MTSPPPRTRAVRLLDGGTFRVGPRTVSIDLCDVLHVPMGCHWLHLNASTACVEIGSPPGGTPAQVTIPGLAVVPPSPVDNPGKGWACRVELPAVVRFVGPDSKQLPPIMRRMARHVAAMPQRQLPWRPGEARGFPSRSTPGTTLWVQTSNGAAWLEVTDATPATPSQAPTAVPATQLERMPPATAVAWLHAEGYRFVPATLHRLAREQTGRGRADETPPPPASG